MKLSAPELAALCEYVDGRRAAGCSYDDIADELTSYTGGADPRLTAEDLDNLEVWHRQWVRRQAYLQKQRASGDVRGGGGGIREVVVDFAAADAGAVPLDKLTTVTDPTLFERSETLRAVMYLKRGLLKACWKWVSYKQVPITEDMEWEERQGPGRMKLRDGGETEWLWGAVILRRRGEVVEVMEECRRRKLRPAGWNRIKHRSLEVQRRELDGEKIDLRDISARLATLLHTCLGGSRSPFRNNEHLAQLLGVTREAMRVRKKRIMTDAGMQSVEGLVPSRGKGGRVSQQKRKAGRGKISDVPLHVSTQTTHYSKTA